MTTSFSRRIASLAAALACAAPAGAHAQTWERTIGTMCIEGVPTSAVKTLSTAVQNGTTVKTFRVAYTGSSGRVRVFREPPTAPAPLAKCSELKGNLLFEGSILELKINNARESSELLRIDEGDLYLELTRTKSNLSPLYGGVLRLGQDGAIAPSSRAWLRNREQLIAEAQKPARGSLDITTWGRQLKGVKVVLPGTAQETVLDMDAGNENVTIRVPFDGGPTQLIAGSFATENMSIRVDALDLPGSRFEGYEGTAARIYVDADENAVRFNMANIPFRATRSSLRVGQSEGASTNTQGSIKSITAFGPRFGDQLTLAKVSVGEIQARGAECKHTVRSALVAASDSCAVTSSMADGSRKRLKFDAASTTSMIGAPMFESAAAVQLTTLAAWEAGTFPDEFTGQFVDTSTRFGTLEMAKQMVNLRSPIDVNGRIEFPFSFSVPPSQGTWRMRLPEGKLAMTGALRTLRGKGLISTDITKPSDWAVEIAKGDLAFDAGVEAVLEPLLYGSKPQFGSVGLRFSTHTPVRITPAGATGALLAGADALLVIDPVVSLGDAPGAMVLKGPANFDAGVELTYQLADGRTEVETGRLRIDDAKLETKPGQPGDLGEIRIQEGSVGFQKLEASFKEGKGKGTLDGLNLIAASIQSKPRADPSTSGNQLVWIGKPNGPISIASVEGEILKDETTRALKLGDVVVRNVQAQLSDVRLGQGKALKFEGGSLRIAIAEFGAEKIIGALALRGAHIKSSSPNNHGMTHVETSVSILDVNITGGPPSAPNGTGRLETLYLDLQTDSKIEIKESCDGVPDFDGVPVRANVKTGPIKIDLTVSGGGLNGSGMALITLAEVKDRGKYKCQAKVIDWPVVKEQRAIYDYPCPTWSKPLRTCRGWAVVVPEVKVVFDRVIEVRSFQAAGFFTTMSLTLEGTDTMKSCGKLGAVVPLADISYYVTPRSSIPILDKIIKEIIDQTARPFTSAFVSGVGGLYGTIMPITGGGLCL